MGEKRAEGSDIGQFVAQLVARKSRIDQKKYLCEACLGRFSASGTIIVPEGSSYSLFFD
jgi:hypothetical protein